MKFKFTEYEEYIENLVERTKKEAPKIKGVKNLQEYLFRKLSERALKLSIEHWQEIVDHPRKAKNGSWKVMYSDGCPCCLLDSKICSHKNKECSFCIISKYVKDINCGGTPWQYIDEFKDDWLEWKESLENQLEFLKKVYNYYFTKTGEWKRGKLRELRMTNEKKKWFRN